MERGLTVVTAMDESPWKRRLYDAYVSSGQAASRPSAGAGLSAAEMFAPFAPQTRHFIDAYVPPSLDARIVDFGCGDGMLVHFLLEAGYRHVSGVDRSAQQVARAHRMGLAQVAQGSIEHALAEAGDASIDVAVFVDVLEHLTRSELFRVLDETVRVLRPGGTCIAHVPNAEGLYGMRVRYGDLTHERAFTPRSARQLFLTVGCSDVSVHEDKPVVHGPTSALRRILWEAGTLPHRVLLAAETGAWGAALSQNIVVRATK